MTRTCPDELQLASTIDAAPDAALVAHVTTCIRCRRVRDDYERTSALARELAAEPPTREERAAMRAHVLAAASVRRRTHRPKISRPWVAGAIVTAAVAALWLVVVGTGSSPTRASRRGIVAAQPGATYTLATTLPDETVRLSDGALDIEVEPLRNGERFRVVVGDAEVEVRGTAFHVIARGDQLVAVFVRHGVVDVRSRGGTTTRLTAGQSWLATELTAHAPVHDADAASSSASIVSRDAPAAQAVRSTESAPVRTHRRASVVPPARSVPSAAAVRPASPVTSEPPASPAPLVQPSLATASPSISAPATASSPTSSPPTASPAISAPATASPPISGPQTESPRIAAPAPPSEPKRSADQAPGERAFEEGWSAMRSGNFGAAAAAFERALAVAHGAIAEEAAYGRGVALARAGRKQDATLAFRALLAAYPQSAHAAEVSVMLGWIFYDDGRDAEAERYFRAAIDAADATVRASARSGLDALGK